MAANNTTPQSTDPTNTNTMTNVSTANNQKPTVDTYAEGKEFVEPDKSNLGGLVGYNIDTQFKKSGTDPFDGLAILDTEETQGNLVFYLPQYGVEEYINDRTIWQKQLYTIGGEQGWFYFKVFFNFNTQHGLLGGLLTEKNQPILAKHSAMAYLASIEKRYKREQIPHRMLALYKFGSTLRSIQSETPWLIKGINGLDQINGVNVNDFGKLKTIELVMNNETTDMRIGTMLDLYKYACYDSLNCKEIIPGNLRRFEMSVLCFHVPIKGYQTKIYSEATSTIVTKETTKTKDDGTVKTKTTKSRGDVINAKTTFLANRNQTTDFGNMMSFKLFSFKNCEFSTETLDGSIGGSLSNETAFNLGGQTIKINYERVYEHRMNEFGEFFMGDTGFMYNETAPSAFIGTGKLYEGMKNPYKINEQEGQNLQHKRYGFLTDKRNLYEFTDGVIRDANIDATSWGDLNSFSVGREGKDNLGTRRNSSYLNAKLKALKQGTLGKNTPTTALRSFTTGGFNLLSDWINGVTKKNNPTGSPQNRTGIGDKRTNTDYFNEKLKALDDGSITFSGDIEKAIAKQEKGWTWAPNMFKKNRVDKGDGRENTEYFNEKLAQLDDGSITFSGDIEKEIAEQEKGWTLAPNMFKKNRGAKGDGRENTDYFKTKLKALDDGSIRFSDDIEKEIEEQEKGWTWDHNMFKKNRVAKGNGRENTDYFNAKLKALDDGVVKLPNDKPTGLSGGNLYNLQEKLRELREGTIK